jgi:hypothetical protein
MISLLTLLPSIEMAPGKMHSTRRIQKKNEEEWVNAEKFEAMRTRKKKEQDLARKQEAEDKKKADDKRKKIENNQEIMAAATSQSTASPMDTSEDDLLGL